MNENKYPDIEKDGMNGMVTVSLERYEELLDCETRIAVAIEYAERAQFLTANDILAFLGATAKEEGKEEGKHE